MALTPQKVYAILKKYTDDSIAGGGISAGKNCTIESIDPITGGNRITFQWTLDNGTVKTDTLDVMNGQNGAPGQDGAPGKDGKDGKDGAPGANGLTPDITISTVTGGHRVTVTIGTSEEYFDVLDGKDGAPGVGVPTGGTTGQVLKKKSNTNYDTEWGDGGGSEHGIPSGGTSGQLLSKNSGTDYDVKWVDPESSTQEQSDWAENDTSDVSYIKNKPENLVQDANYVHTDNNYTDADRAIVAGVTSALSNKVDKHGTDSLMTADEHTKLANIATGAQVNVLEGVQVNGTDLTIDANKKVNVVISGKADKVVGATSGNFAVLDSTGNLVDSQKSPSNYYLKTETYSKSEVDSAITVKNAYKKVKVGTTEITASGEDTIELVQGSNVTLTPDASLKKVTISASGGGTSTGDMLAADYDSDYAVKTAGGIKAYVTSQAYSLPIAGSSTLGGVKINGNNLSIDANGVLSATDTTYQEGTGIDITSGVISIDADSSPTSGSNKPITSGGVYSELADYVKKSSTAGLLKNDGTVDTNSYITNSALSDYVQKSNTAGLLKNDGTVDTTTYATSSSLSDYIQKSSTAGLMKNDGTVDTTAYITSSDISGKADKVSNATANNFAGLDSNGNLKDSGSKSSDFQDADDKMTAADMVDVLTPLPSARGNWQVYSTTEQRVGTWIDGKPLYQKTFSYSVGTQSAKATIPVGTLSNVDYIVSCTGICKRGNNLQYEQMSMYDSSAWFVYTSVTMSGTTATVNIVENGRSDATGYVTVQYTKTTD